MAGFDGTPDDIMNEGFEDIRDIVDADLKAIAEEEMEPAPEVQFGDIGSVAQAVRILRFRLAKSDAPARGNEALDFLLAELGKSHLPEEDFDIHIEPKDTRTVTVRIVEVPFVPHIDLDDLDG